MKRLAPHWRALRACAWVVALFLLSNLVYTVVWFSPAVHGRVVERTTGNPIANAAVAASWRLTGGMESSSMRCLQITEAITDADGRFRIAGWGPRFHFGPGSLDRSQPEVFVIADGFMPVSKSSSDHAPAIIYAGPKINGGVYELERAELSVGYQEHLENLLHDLVPEKIRDCRRSNIPEVMQRVVNARHALSEVDLGLGLP